MGISCISQVQEPWGSLPGNGHLWPENLAAIFKSICWGKFRRVLRPLIHWGKLGRIICWQKPWRVGTAKGNYQWDSWAMNTLSFSPSTPDSLDCNSNPDMFLLCTGVWYWCTMTDHSLKGWQLTLPCPHSCFWTQDNRFLGRWCTPRRDRGRPREPSIDRHSLLPARKSPPQRCLV